MEDAPLYIDRRRNFATANGPRKARSASGVSAGEGRRHRPVTQFYLVRHGRTPLNAEGLLRGRLDPELDLTGLAQAMALSDVLGRMDMSLVISSPLKRAVETAMPIAERAGLKVQVDDRLIDRDYGSWAGKSMAEVVARWGSVDGAPGVERQAEVLARSMDALNDIVRMVGTGAAVMVSHEAILQALLSAFDRRLESAGPIPIDPGSFSVVENHGGTWTIKSVNNAPAASHESAVSEQDAHET
jgi:broad specificity phosphatase PhoE